MGSGGNGEDGYLSKVKVAKVDCPLRIIVQNDAAIPNGLAV